MEIDIDKKIKEIINFLVQVPDNLYVAYSVYDQELIYVGGHDIGVRTDEGTYKVVHTKMRKTYLVPNSRLTGHICFPGDSDLLCNLSMCEEFDEKLEITRKRIKNVIRDIRYYFENFEYYSGGDEYVSKQTIDFIAKLLEKFEQVRKVGYKELLEIKMTEEEIKNYKEEYNKPANKRCTIVADNNDKFTIVVLGRILLLSEYLYEQFKKIQIRRYMNDISTLYDMVESSIENEINRSLAEQNYDGGDDKDSNDISERLWVDNHISFLRKRFENIKKSYTRPYNPSKFSFNLSYPLASYPSGPFRHIKPTDDEQEISPVSKQPTPNNTQSETEQITNNKPVNHVEDLIRSEYLSKYKSIRDKMIENNWIIKIEGDSHLLYIWNKKQNQLIRFIEWLKEQEMFKDNNMHWQEFCNDFMVKSKNGAVKKIENKDLTALQKSGISLKTKKEVEDFLDRFRIK
jgi:hypothetical protein